MTATTHGLTLLCVGMIAAGQILFKQAAGKLKLSGTLFSTDVLSLLLIALGIYGVATLLWVFVLQSAPLSRLYPYMALSFVLVTFASWLVFGEHIAPLYILGLALVISGLLVIAAS